MGPWVFKLLLFANQILAKEQQIKDAAPGAVIPTGQVHIRALGRRLTLILTTRVDS